MFNDVLDREQDFFDSRNKDKSKSPNLVISGKIRQDFLDLKKKTKKTAFLDYINKAIKKSKR